jgi:acyl-homoserine lactone synthase
MIVTLRGQERHRHPEVFESLFRLRYEVFVKGRGWSLPAKNGRELDQYDIADTVYFFDLDDRGTIQSSVRITPSLQGSLLADYFPHLIENGASPRAPDIYEATRYIVLPARKSRESNRAAKARLLSALFEWSLEHGLSFIQSVVDTSSLPAFVEMTPQVFPLGLPCPYGGGRDAPGGGECVACRWPISPRLIDEVRSYGDLDVATHDRLLASVH